MGTKTRKRKQEERAEERLQTDASDYWNNWTPTKHSHNDATRRKRAQTNEALKRERNRTRPGELPDPNDENTPF